MRKSLKEVLIILFKGSVNKRFPNNSTLRLCKLPTRFPEQEAGIIRISRELAENQILTTEAAFWEAGKTVLGPSWSRTNLGRLSLRADSRASSGIFVTHIPCDSALGSENTKHFGDGVPLAHKTNRHWFKTWEEICCLKCVHLQSPEHWKREKAHADGKWTVWVNVTDKCVVPLCASSIWVKAKWG